MPDCEDETKSPVREQGEAERDRRSSEDGDSGEERDPVPRDREERRAGSARDGGEVDSRARIHGGSILRAAARGWPSRPVELAPQDVAHLAPAFGDQAKADEVRGAEPRVVGAVRGLCEP